MCDSKGWSFDATLHTILCAKAKLWYVATTEIFACNIVVVGSDSTYATFSMNFSRWPHLTEIVALM